MEKSPRERWSAISTLPRQPRRSRAFNSSQTKPVIGAARLRLRCVRCADTFVGNAEQRLASAVRGDNSKAWNTPDAISRDGKCRSPDTDGLGANKAPWPRVVAGTPGAWPRFHLAFRSWAGAGFKPDTARAASHRAKSGRGIPTGHSISRTQICRIDVARNAGGDDRAPDFLA